MKDDLVEKVARAMCIARGDDPDAPITGWVEAEDGSLYSDENTPPWPQWKDYESFAEPAVGVVLEEVEKTVKQWGKEQIEKADKLDSPEASDHGRARAWDSAQIAHRIRALGEKT
jgi:hypothetical protein